MEGSWMKRVENSGVGNNLFRHHRGQFGDFVSQKSHADLTASLRSSAEVVDSLRKLTRLDKLGNSRFSERPFLSK